MWRYRLPWEEEEQSCGDKYSSAVRLGREFCVCVPVQSFAFSEVGGLSYTGRSKGMVVSGGGQSNQRRGTWPVSTFHV